MIKVGDFITPRYMQDYICDRHKFQKFVEDGVPYFLWLCLDVESRHSYDKNINYTHLEWMVKVFDMREETEFFIQMSEVEKFIGL